MKTLREAAVKSTEVKDAWIDSVQAPISLISGVFSRLKWNDQPIEVSLPLEKLCSFS